MLMDSCESGGINHVVEGGGGGGGGGAVRVVNGWAMQPIVVVCPGSMCFYSSAQRS